MVFKKHLKQQCFGKMTKKKRQNCFIDFYSLTVEQLSLRTKIQARSQKHKN